MACDAHHVYITKRYRYNRFTRDFEDVTGHSAQTVRQYVAEHRDLFA
jgi:hypothetical protein